MFTLNLLIKQAAFVSYLLQMIGTTDYSLLGQPSSQTRV